MGTAKPLLEISPEDEYQACLLPPDVKDLLKKKLRTDPLEPVEALCDVAGERWVIRTGGKRFRLLHGPEGYTLFGDRPRHYASTPLPTLRKSENLDRRVLLALYTEVCSGWRMLTDVRFKLLALVPAVSVIAWVELVKEPGLTGIPGAWAGLVLSLAGLGVTVLLRIYDLRNDELYDDLISRGRKIEEELGVDTAIFRGRPRSVGTRLKHGTATTGIYAVAMLGWVGMAAWFAARLLRVR